jgi:hypothetical protein
MNRLIGVFFDSTGKMILADCLEDADFLTEYSINKNHPLHGVVIRLYHENEGYFYHQKCNSERLEKVQVYGLLVSNMKYLDTIMRF